MQHATSAPLLLSQSSIRSAAGSVVPGKLPSLPPDDPTAAVPACRADSSITVFKPKSKQGTANRLLLSMNATFDPTARMDAAPSVRAFESRLIFLLEIKDPNLTYRNTCRNQLNCPMVRNSSTVGSLGVLHCVCATTLPFNAIKSAEPTFVTYLLHKHKYSQCQEGHPPFVVAAAGHAPSCLKHRNLQSLKWPYNEPVHLSRVC